MNGMSAFQLVDPYGIRAEQLREAGNVRNVLYGRVTCEQYEDLLAGEKRTISFSLAPSGLFQSAYMFPLMHGSVSVELLLVSSPKDCCMSTWAQASQIAAKPRSERFQINQPRLCY